MFYKGIMNLLFQKITLCSIDRFVTRHDRYTSGLHSPSAEHDIKYFLVFSGCLLWQFSLVYRSVFFRKLNRVTKHYFY